jgi:uncharacterized protein (DUF2225 family)
MTSDSPFFLVKVECPICKTINEFETVKVGAYSEGERDSDFCPSSITWRYPKYQAYNPLAFFTVACSNCYYTREFTNKFKEWKKDSTFRTYRLKPIKEKHLELLATSDSIIKKMGDAIDLGNYPNESAVIKLHLAIMDESLNEHASQLDMGRFYLRIGWVFRYLGVSEPPHLLLARGLVQEVEKKFERVKNSLAGANDSLNEFGSFVAEQSSSSDLSTDLQSLLLPYREKFETAASDISTHLDSCNDAAGKLRNLIGEYRTAALGRNDGSGGGFGSNASFIDFLSDLSTQWEGITCSENEALELAIKHYTKAFTTGKDIADGNPQIQASYLIAELSRRVGDYDGAKQYFNTTIKLGQEFIFKNRRDQSRTALARKILELAIEQGRTNLKASKGSK